MRERREIYDISIQKHIEQILEVLSDGIYISDRHGRTLMVNSVYERLTGLKRENLVGQPVQVLIQKGFDIILNPQIVQTGKPTTSVQTDPKGNKLLLSGYPILDEDGQVALVVTFVRDVTLMTQLKDQIASQRRLIDQFQTSVQHIHEEFIQKHPIIVNSPAAVELAALIDKVAVTDATVLLQGETGVGKDVFARKIHQLSPRRSGPFFKVDCPTIPHDLIESELFGYAPGAFSGANAKGKIGLFELAHKGTLFLDEIGELPLDLQAKLLRVLQDREIIRVGSTRIREIDVRIIAATNRDIEEEVQQGRFRSDLFYRLRVAVVSIPPLRERKEDILPLARSFLDRFSARYGKNLRLDDEVARALSDYRWPGNVRELENLMQTMVITSERERIQVSDLPGSMAGRHANGCRKGETSPKVDAPAVPGVKGMVLSLPEIIQNSRDRTLREIIDDIECEILRRAVEVHGSVAKAAERLHVNRSTVFRKIQKSRGE
ncbi:MAG: PAS domain S-box protein [Desulfobacteraceae bacterium]|nr:MAG: PAS domain S-box protein [Desulfobacteraceae bacterium]